MTSLQHIRLSSATTRRPAPGPLAMVTKWIETRATRAALARLDAHLLADVGLEPAMARHESGRPFWRE